MPIGTAAAIVGGASLLGGIGNYMANSSAADRAAAIQNSALQEWLKVNIPNPEEQKVALERFVNQGTLTPKLEASIKADPSAFKDIVTSSSNRAAQNRALSELQNVGYQGGLRLQDKAALQDSMMNAQVQERANRQGIAADMARRGTGGSGFEVAAQLQGQQGLADQNAQNSLKVAASAQDRALQAIMGAGDLASKYRTQDFGEQAQKATAADKINLFNTNNLQDVQMRNNAMLNRAQEMNLAQKQKTADQNTGLSNAEQMYNKGLLQQQFDNQAKRAAGMAGQYGQQAGLELQKGQNLGNFFSNVGGGIANAGAAQAQQDFWNKYLDRGNNNLVAGVTSDSLEEYKKKYKMS